MDGLVPILFNIFGSRSRNTVPAEQRELIKYQMEAFKRLFPLVSSRYEQMLNETPDWIRQMQQIGSREIGLAERANVGTALANLERRGVIDSGILGSAMSGIHRESSKALSDMLMNLGQTADQRTAGILNALSGLATGTGSSLQDVLYRYSTLNEARRAQNIQGISSLMSGLGSLAGLYLMFGGFGPVGIGAAGGASGVAGGVAPTP